MCLELEEVILYLMFCWLYDLSHFCNIAEVSYGTPVWAGYWIHCKLYFIFTATLGVVPISPLVDKETDTLKKGSGWPMITE